MNKELLKEAKKCLVLVDMNKGFMEKGSLADPSMKRIVPPVVALVKQYIGEKQPIIAFLDTHNKKSIELKNFPNHCMEGTSETELIENLKPFAKSMKLFKKNSTCGVFAEGYLSYIEQMPTLEMIEVVGVCGDICISNYAITQKCYFDQHNKNIEIVVHEDKIDTFQSPTHNRMAYLEMAKCLMEQSGVKVLRKEIIK